MAPSPSEASLYDEGTTFKDSSVVRIITGKIIIDNVEVFDLDNDEIDLEELKY